MNTIKKNTIGMFDCLRGGILIFVVLYHSYTDIWVAGQFSGDPALYKILKVLPGILMGLMLMISGYGFKPLKSKKTLKIQAKQLLWPCVVVYVIGLLMRIPLNLIMGHSPLDGMGQRLLGLAFGMVSTKGPFGIQVYTIFVFWYLIALFLGWILLTLIFKITKQEKIRGLLVGLCVCAGYLLSLLPGSLPFCIEQTLLSIGFLYFGYLIKKKNLLFKKWPIWLFILLAAAGALTLKLGRMDIASSTMELGLLDYMGTLCSAAVVMKLYIHIFCPSWKVYTPLLFWGRNAMMILCIHGLENLVFDWRSLNLPQFSNPQTGAWLLFVIRVALIMIMFYITQLWHKLKPELHKRKNI